MKTAHKDIHPLVDFPAGSTVLDVGCGSGRHLVALAERGVKGIGVEPNAESIAAAKAKGLDVRAGRAENLPLDDASCDGLICNVALGYMDERKAVAEWARVLKPGAEARAVLHGAGYALWLIANAPLMPTKLYGGRLFLSTWIYRLTGKKVGHRWQTTRRMAQYYRRFGLELLEVDESQKFLGVPVVLFHRVRKKQTDERF